MGLILLVGVTALNQLLFSGGVHMRHALAPALVGLLLGLWLGLYRRKWLEQEWNLAATREELERRLEEAVRQELLTNHLQGLVQGAPVPFFLKGRDFRYLLVNEAFEEITGRNRGEVLGMTDHDIFPDPVADIFREQDDLVMREAQARTFEETLPLGRKVPTLRTSKFPLLGSGGAVQAVGGIVLDISRLKEAEDETALERRRLQGLIGAIDQGVILTGRDGKITHVSPRVAQVLDLAATEMVGQDRDGLDLPPGCRDIPLQDRYGQVIGGLVVLSCGESPPLKTETAAAEPAVRMAGMASGRTVLVMDDDHLVRKTSRMMLVRLGFEVLSCENGREAVELYRELQGKGTVPDAVIMDLTVPGDMGGVEATAAILERDPQARIMVASGYSKDPVLANYRDYGFLARVEKPFSSQKLREALRQTLAG